MKKALIGSGGFSDEVKAHMNDFNMVCFVDDEYYFPNDKNIKPLSQFNVDEYEVAIAIGDPFHRESMVNKLPKETKYFTFVHPSAQILGNNVEIGYGSLICAGVVITTNCKIGNHAHLNLLTTIGHDNTIGDFFTTAPGAKISGNCVIGNKVYFGTNSSVKQKITICDNVTIGLNGGVVKSISEMGTYVGVPAKKIKPHH
jgi:sugar O-acyltransferase (sialic acid O-acetyltransferase NeuD family)